MRGVTHALLKEAAPITVTCFAKNLKIYAEEIPLPVTENTDPRAAVSFCFARSIPICIPTSLAYICRRKKALSQYSENVYVIARYVSFFIGHIACY